ncbi:MAG: [FeFe] hydrogenase H-cluster maturation GTPase HydF, partial [Bacteroidales bacterium]|nr:[FeFe] hydrogenase H-cluster maturation GTPase HydF [Bacteroidales bacterium]
IPGLGPCVLIDTAGLDDDGVLGAERMRLTRNVIDETDVAVVLPPVHLLDLKEQGIPIVEYIRGESIESLIQRIKAVAPKREEHFLTGSLVKAGDLVILVMPQDSEAPKGRLILPQVQVIRELLDRGCVPVCCTPASLSEAIRNVTPALVITDSQVFKTVNETIPREWPLTSFSVLLAAAKGDMRVFLEGARAIDTLQPGSRVLIAEACTHVPDTEDIGRVKIPALLRMRIGELHVDIAAGNDFPEDLTPYSLIIHCGACVATSTLVRSRTRKAQLAGVPITNYGLAIAHLQGILPRIVLP